MVDGGLYKQFINNVIPNYRFTNGSLYRRKYDSSIHHAASMFLPVGIKQRFSSSYKRFIVFTPARLITKNAGTLI
jgi:hypothetical protein